MPVQQNAAKPTPPAAIGAERGDIDLHRCPSCDFVWNVAFDPSASIYGEEYENDQTRSAVFERHVDRLVEHVAELAGNGHVVEIGCGNGYFLRRLADATGCTGTGYDTSYRGPAEAMGGRLRFETSYFAGDERADVVLCRHVIEHVPEPLTLLRSMRSALGPAGVVLIETPSLAWILDGGVYQDIFYEHCSYFVPASLARACELAGLRVRSVRAVFGEQYLWLEATPTGVSEPQPESPVEEALRRFVTEERRRRQAMEASLARWASDGAVAVWGAGAKGVTFVNLLDRERRLVDCLVDVNPAKQGRFVPGTAHPIVAPEALRKRGVRTAIVMNPNYLEECRTLVASIAPEVRLELEIP